MTTRFPLILALVSLSAMAQKPNGPTTDGMSTLQAVHDNYRYLIAGNKRDLARNTQTSELFRKKYFDARKAKHPRARDYYNVSFYYNQLAEANKAILTAISSNQHGDLKTPMILVPKIEQRIMAITNRPIERKWLTTEEMMDYIKAGVPYRSAANHVLPYATACWDPAGVQKHKNGQAVTPRQPTPRKR
ncbi:MAG: hypothetical protein ACI8W8_002422 [Rhodothermales bacterium]|jgi:hypothetical protein